MTEATSTARLREALANRTGTRPQDWYPVFKARYGMFAAFSALHDVRGEGTVLTQLFTCCTAVDPIVDAGLTPRYEEVDAGTLSIDAKALADSVVGETRPVHAVMLQHTFGIIDNAADLDLSEAVRSMPRTLLVEDCAHCACRMARGDDGGPLADVSVHSFGVEKILPTRFGGAIWINPRLAQSDPVLDAELRGRLDALPRPGARLDFVTRVYVNENRVLSRLGGLGGTLRGALTRAGLYEPPIADSERAGKLSYAPMKPTPWIEDRAADAIGALHANEEGRKRVVAIYRDLLGHAADELGIPSGVMTGRPQPLLRFPLFLKSTEDAERVLKAVRAAGGYAERWYRPELFPGVSDPAAYGVTDEVHGRLPVTEGLVAGAVCLPTELGDDERARTRARAICDAVLGCL
ncbi:DegT/DnrJ/EryC1/StrS family aminotransferase [Bifidobacterium avesanii]|uniref:DegT/DnrJ/EryC1/StrS aminotransferase family protein n=1 Tax=Bifidobacterium avesanii TaxID=1798157 RepID=A0A7K3TI82_9BIFI|nr:DegT/DnrJ/EryC1/StrS family aminotransferase [Bifidobacterium avesanii]KAB8291005.1 aminotransferase DegT [Bifidobacterium avesanii]NEG78772.1 DegT/DnrJ/EryC1/StrS aminotransferase family protein [Bifidobacterium avesanii]